MTDERPVCQDHDPAVFYPHRADRAANRFAVALCKSCDLRDGCLEGALERQEEFGIWGGTTERERAKLLRGAVR